MPFSALLEAADENFYGMTAGGGIAGAAFKMTGDGIVTVLHSFVGLTSLHSFTSRIAPRIESL